MVIIPVQPMHAVQFLAAVLVALNFIVCAFTEETAKGIVMVHLLNSATTVAYHTIIALVVLNIEVILGRCAVERNIPSLEQSLLQSVILIDQIATIIHPGMLQIGIPISPFSTSLLLRYRCRVRSSHPDNLFSEANLGNYTLCCKFHGSNPSLNCRSVYIQHL